MQAPFPDWLTTLGAASVGAVAAVTSLRFRLSLMRREIRQLQRGQQMTLTLLVTIAEKQGLAPEMLRAVTRFVETQAAA